VMGLGVGGGCGVGLGLGWGIGLGWGSKYINQHFVFEETTRSKRAVDSPQVRLRGCYSPAYFAKPKAKKGESPLKANDTE
jgi:hypothetical protein